MPLVETDERLVRYLLGELSDQDRAQIEDLYVSQHELFERLLMCEDEIIDSYVYGTMSDRGRELFQRNFLCSPQRRERVIIAGTLARYAKAHSSTRPVQAERKEEVRERPSSFFRPAGSPRILTAAALIVLLFGGIFGWRELVRLRSGLEALRAEQSGQQERSRSLEHEIKEQRKLADQLNLELDRERGERGRLEQQLAKLREQKSPAAIFSLGPGFAKRPGAGQAKILKVEIPSGREMVKFQLALLADQYKTYRVIVKDENDKTLWQGYLQSSRTRTGPAVIVRLPSQMFASGNYLLSLSGVLENNGYEHISDFQITVSRR
jgi:hypothetical protein